MLTAIVKRKKTLRLNLALCWALATAGIALLVPSCRHGTGIQSSAADGRDISINDLAGDYCFRMGLDIDCNLSLSDRGKFKYQWLGRHGILFENDGGARIQNGVLHLTPRKYNMFNKSVALAGTMTDLYPVRWDARIYLIPTNYMVDFCSIVNLGLEPRLGLYANYYHYYLRRNDWEKPVTGKPVVPEPWAKYVLSQPVRGKITQLLDKQEAWFDMGAEAGLLEGMILVAQENGKFRCFAQVRIEAVEKDRCRIKSVWKDLELQAGQAVSSRSDD